MKRTVEVGDIEEAEAQLKETLKDMTEHGERTHREVVDMCQAAIHGAGQYLMEMAWRDAELVRKAVTTMESVRLIVGLFAFAAFDALGDFVRSEEELERLEKSASSYIVLARGVGTPSGRDSLAQLTCTSFQCQLATQLYPAFLRKVDKYLEVGVAGMAAIMERMGGGGVDN